EVIAKEGQTLAVGEPIAKIGDAPDSEGSPDAGDENETDDVEDEHDGTGVAASGEVSEPVKASPVAQRLAEKQGVELESLEGSGPGGRVVKADVEDAAAAPKRTAKGSV